MGKKKKERRKWLKRTKGKMSKILRKARKGHKGEKGEDREEGKGKNRKKESQKTRQRNLLFWNVAGIGNKDTECWNYILGFDYVSLNETWLEEKRWEKWKRRLPRFHKWACSFVEKEKRKGRDFIIGKKKEWEVQGCELISREEGGMMVMTEFK